MVAYFSATGNTQRIARRIAELTGADIYRIQPAEPYAENPYDDSDKIQNEAYNDLRPGVANLPENLDKYDTIFVGSPIWWHQPAMVVCTFLESYDLNGKTVIPFFTYDAKSYLNEAMQKIYKVTPTSAHIPAVLPEDLDPDNIREPQDDDAEDQQHHRLQRAHPHVSFAGVGHMRGESREVNTCAISQQKKTPTAALTPSRSSVSSACDHESASM